MDTCSEYVSIVIPTYRDAERAADAVGSLLTQHLPAGLLLEILVVDDGSADGSAEQLRALQQPGVEILAMPVNRGRSATRNLGAQHARGDIIVFMDCDCLPLQIDFLAAHHAAFKDLSVVACTGNVKGDGSEFWGLYQERASNRRRKQHASGVAFAGSSQNLSVRKSAFHQVDGFDVGYTEYGFEDRDLLVRMAQLGRIAWADHATVLHRDRLNMLGTTQKMRLAGGSSAERFSRSHPAAYAALGYAALDARLRPAWRKMAPPVNCVLPTLARGFDKIAATGLMPFTVGAPVAKVLGGMAFMLGTCTPLHPHC